MTNLQALRGEAFDLIAEGHRKLAEGHAMLARLEETAPAPNGNGRGSGPDLISVDEALRVIPTPMKRATLLKQVGGMSWVRRPSPRKVVFERAGFTRWMASR